MTEKWGYVHHEGEPDDDNIEVSGAGSIVWIHALDGSVDVLFNEFAYIQKLTHLLLFSLPMLVQCLQQQHLYKFQMKVTLYRSNDGKLHENKADCDRHDAMLAAAPAIKQSIHADHSLEGDDDVLSVDDICTWAVKNAGQLVEILSPFVPAKPRVPRKPKVAVGTATGADPSAAAVISKAMETEAA